ncbi:hypothetical protein [Seohaeicola zhoushanensis]|uniref:DUF4399 domain-containing protein n=1 Tax=Seohaeicola zhoushanensis TaxID=1569283 RepID=A0A8J3GWA6_9RHOB|nr:hypothetical protein [Seohaeicola zhoushanensis]GHF43257.1 hypothetical protein GCM10017056_13940 [Seohaeicola zhoushanensis]
MLDRGLALFGIGLVFGGGFGFLTAAGMGVTLDGHDHATGHGHAEAPAHDHAHADPVEIAPGGTVPGVTLAALPDSAGGWNVHVAVSDFTFSPENAGQGDVAGEGHVHLYLDGEKVARVYGPWVHLGAGQPGQVLSAALYSNDHRPLTSGGVPIEASVTLGQ